MLLQRISWNLISLTLKGKSQGAGTFLLIFKCDELATCKRIEFLPSFFCLYPKSCQKPKSWQTNQWIPKDLNNHRQFPKNSTKKSQTISQNSPKIPKNSRIPKNNQNGRTIFQLFSKVFISYRPSNLIVFNNSHLTIDVFQIRI